MSLFCIGTSAFLGLTSIDIRQCFQQLIFFLKIVSVAVLLQVVDDVACVVVLSKSIGIAPCFKHLCFTRSSFAALAGSSCYRAHFDQYIGLLHCAHFSGPVLSSAASMLGLYRERE